LGVAGGPVGRTAPATGLVPINVLAGFPFAAPTHLGNSLPCLGALLFASGHHRKSPGSFQRSPFRRIRERLRTVRSLCPRRHPVVRAALLFLAPRSRSILSPCAALSASSSHEMLSVPNPALERTREPAWPLRLAFRRAPLSSNVGRHEQALAPPSLSEPTSGRAAGITQRALPSRHLSTTSCMPSLSQHICTPRDAHRGTSQRKSKKRSKSCLAADGTTLPACSEPVLSAGFVGNGKCLVRRGGQALASVFGT